MRYHYNENDILFTGIKHANIYGACEGKLFLQYQCNHLVYSTCTLYKLGDRGLAVIQQKYDTSTKGTWWSSIDSDIAFSIYINRNFKKFFDTYAGEMRPDKSYPTVTVRQIMWALRMKPLKKERWETVFDHKDI